MSEASALIQKIRLYVKNTQRDETLRQLIDEAEEAVRDLEGHDLEWYLEHHPHQIDEVEIPTGTATRLWRSGAIDLGTSTALTVGGLCDLLDA